MNGPHQIKLEEAKATGFELCGSVILEASLNKKIPSSATNTERDAKQAANMNESRSAK